MKLFINITKTIKIKPLLTCILFIACLHSPNTSGQICKSGIKSKYVSLEEKIITGAKISSLISHSVVSVKDGFWICGIAYLTNSDAQFFYAKLNDTGKLLFFKTAGLLEKEGGYSVRMAATPSGGIVISGQTFESSISIYLAAIISIDNQGKIKWFRKTPSANNSGKLDAIRGMMIDPNGDVICVGDAQQYSNLVYSRVLVCKLDSNGNQKFINQIDLSIGGNSQQAHPSGIQSTPNGYLVSGWISSSQIPFILLFDKTTGAAISSYYFNSSGICSPDKLIFSPTGKTYIAGYTNSLGTRDGFIAALDYNTGKIFWQKAISSAPGSDDLFNHVHFENNILYASVLTNGIGINDYRQGFVAIDTNGNVLSGNGIYYGGRNFLTAHSGNDFDVLKSGGAVFIGIDDGISYSHFNFAILSPCFTNGCSSNAHTYSAENTNIKVDNVNTVDYTQGDLLVDYPFSDSVEFKTTIECIQDQINSNTSFVHHICNGDSIKIAGKFRKTKGIYIDSFKNYLGKDSLVKHQVYVHSLSADTFKFHLCNHEKITIDGNDYSSETIFNKTYKTAFGCDSIVTYIITKSKLKANFDIDSSKSPKIQFFNASTGNFKSYWDFGDATFDSTTNNPTHTYNDETKTAQICLIVLDSFGCQDTICKTIEIPDLIYWLLNSFSPGNDDGFNDVFKIGHKGRNFYYDIMIYSRWGVLVYETQNASIFDNSKFWNGQVMNTGANCPAGSYFVLYKLYVDGVDNPPKEIHGVITLIRD